MVAHIERILGILPGMPRVEFGLAERSRALGRLSRFVEDLDSR